MSAQLPNYIDFYFCYHYLLSLPLPLSSSLITSFLNHCNCLLIPPCHPTFHPIATRVGIKDIYRPSEPVISLLPLPRPQIHAITSKFTCPTFLCLCPYLCYPTIFVRRTLYPLNIGSDSISTKPFQKLIAIPSSVLSLYSMFTIVFFTVSHVH